MSNTTAPSLRDWLLENRMEPTDLADKLGINAGNIYLWSFQNKVPQKHHAELQKLGFDASTLEIRVSSAERKLEFPQFEEPNVSEINAQAKEAIKAQAEEVSPKKAKRWLKLNKINRTLNRRAVKNLARDMTEGRWFVNPQDCICFAPDGRLLNGQHRLNAVVESGQTVTLYVATNVPPEVQEVMDKVRVRRVADNLSMHHSFPREYARKMPSLTRYLNAFRFGRWETPVERDCKEVWNQFQDSILWFTNEAEETEWNKGAYYSTVIVWLHHHDPELAKSFHRAIAMSRPQIDQTPAAAIARKLGSKELRTGGTKGFAMALRVLNAARAFDRNDEMKRVFVSTVGFDYFMRKFKLTSKGLKGKCLASGCSHDPVDRSGMCWVHKNYGRKSKYKK